MRAVLGRRPRRAATLAGACALLGILAAGCARTQSVAASGPEISFTCCATDVSARVWHPGQQITIDWARLGHAPAAGVRLSAPITLKAVLSGPYSSVAALKSITVNGGGAARLATTAPALKIVRVPAVAPVSVITLPPGTAPGYYNLKTTEVSGGFSAGGDTIIRVSG